MRQTEAGYACIIYSKCISSHRTHVTAVAWHAPPQNYNNYRWHRLRLQHVYFTITLLGHDIWISFLNVTGQTWTNQNLTEEYQMAWRRRTKRKKRSKHKSFACKKLNVPLFFTFPFWKLKMSTVEQLWVPMFQVDCDKVGSFRFQLCSTQEHESLWCRP